MKLYKKKATREGFERYVDLFLGWTYQGVKFCVRVRPVFGSDNDKLIATAISVPDGELVESYIED